MAPYLFPREADGLQQQYVGEQDQGLLRVMYGRE